MANALTSANTEAEFAGVRSTIPNEYADAFRKTLVSTYFAQFAPGYAESPSGKPDVENHVAGRMVEFERVVIPWIEEHFPLHGKTVLEIGCGTGSATVPVARRAASVRAYDISATSLGCAKERARLLGVGGVDFRQLDLKWAATPSAASAFVHSENPVDAVLFIALLEHLTIPERINALRAAWQLLKPDGVLVVYETPNRLAFYDWHSFELPFFQTLPDQLAIQYAHKSKRPHFSIDTTGDVVENLYRLGRGVSYHEFELTIGFANLDVVNDGFSPLLTHRRPLERPAFDRALEDIFRDYVPEVPIAFARPSLDLVIQKRAPSRRPALSGELRRKSQLDEATVELRRRISEYERKFGSQTELTREFVALTSRNLKTLLRDPARFRQMMRGWWNRRIRGR